jgi:hypothetical protein
MGPGGAVGLNSLAVDRIFDYLEIPLNERDDLLWKVHAIASFCLRAQYDEQERKSKQNSKK